jgi:hypothetical protein
VLYGSRVTVSARAQSVKDAVLQERSSDGAWHALQNIRHQSQLSIQPRASTAYRLVAPGTNGTSVSVAVAPRLQVHAQSPRVLVGEVSPRPDAAVAVWRVVHGRWRIVAHPILNAGGSFRTELPLRPVDYRITVAAGRMAAVQKSLHLTRRMLEGLRQS